MIHPAVAVLLPGADLTSSVLVESILLAVPNLAATVLVVLTTPVEWWAAPALGLGCSGGGYPGPALQKATPEAALRRTVVVAGVGLAVWLWVHR